MKLQILITHYKEPESTIKPLLDSIQTQKDIPPKEFGVIIVNDGDEGLLSDEFLSGYDFKIKYLVMPKGNVSKARNYALDHATAKYVMFCDCDDEFLVDCAFWWIFREMKKPFKVLNSVFFQQEGEQGVPHEHDNTFIHGKVWDRQFLIDNDLRFDEELYVHEDGYFVLLAQTVAVVIRYFPHPFYLWCQSDSISRQKGFIQNTWREYLKAKDKVIIELLRRGKQDVAATTVAILMIEAKERNLNKINMFETAKFYEKHKELFNSIPDEEREIICKNASEQYKHKVNLSMAYFERLLNMRENS